MRTSSLSLQRRLARLEGSRRVRAKVHPPVVFDLLWAQDDAVLLPGLDQSSLELAHRKNPGAALFFPRPVTESEWNAMARVYRAPTSEHR